MASKLIPRPPGDIRNTSSIRSFQCDHALWSEVKIIARQCDVSASEVVRVALQQFLESWEYDEDGRPNAS